MKRRHLLTAWVSAEETVRELFRVLNSGRFEDLARVYAPVVDHDGRRETPADLIAWQEAEAETWADSRYDVLSLVSDGVEVAVRWRATARQVGAWGPVPPTGREIIWDGVHFFTVVDDRITALWATADRFAKAMQLGVTFSAPAPE